MQNAAAATSLGAVHAGPSPARYPETPIGALGLYAATCTEPLGYGSAGVQRACGDSWPELAEDLRLFSQEDPIGFDGGLHLYNYAASDPLVFSDPSGLVSAGVVPGVSGTVARGMGRVARLPGLPGWVQFLESGELGGAADTMMTTEALFVAIESGALDHHLFSKGTSVGDDEVTDEARALLRLHPEWNGDICRALRELMRQAKACGDVQKALKIRRNEKRFGCSGRDKQRGGPVK